MSNRAEGGGVKERWEIEVLTEAVQAKVAELNAALNDAGKAGIEVQLDVVDVTVYGDPVRTWAVAATLNGQ